MKSDFVIPKKATNKPAAKYAEGGILKMRFKL